MASIAASRTRSSSIGSLGRGRRTSAGVLRAAPPPDQRFDFGLHRRGLLDVDLVVVHGLHLGLDDELGCREDRGVLRRGVSLDAPARAGPRRRQSRSGLRSRTRRGAPHGRGRARSPYRRRRGPGPVRGRRAWRWRRGPRQVPDRAAARRGARLSSAAAGLRARAGSAHRPRRRGVGGGSRDRELLLGRGRLGHRWRWVDVLGRHVGEHDLDVVGARAARGRRGRADVLDVRLAVRLDVRLDVRLGSASTSPAGSSAAGGPVQVGDRFVGRHGHVGEP